MGNEELKKKLEECEKKCKACEAKLRRSLGSGAVEGSLSRIYAEEAFEDAKSEFLMIAAHQLRTPLAPIKLVTELLLSGAVGMIEKKQREYLIQIQQATEKMIKLVNDLLIVSSLEVGSIEGMPQETELEPFIEKVISDVKEKLFAGKCDVTFKKIEGAPIIINIDRSLLYRVIQTLIINAVVYSRKGACGVLVDVQKGPDNCIIKVEDYGIGISVDAEPLIFSKFFRATNAIKAHPNGLGLNLYAAKKIMEKIGGKIWFESEPNKRSTFFVSVPIYKTAD